MGVVISKPAINLREQLTELKATQGYEERQFHFDGLVTNGTFDTDISGWAALTATVSWDASGALSSNASGGAMGAYQNIATVAGKTYAVKAVSTSATTLHRLRVNVGSFAGAVIVESSEVSSPTAFSLTFTATSAITTVYLRNGEAGTVLWDNVYVYEVDPNDSNKVIHTMPKGWKPLHVFEDGALQREGSAYDYTVEYDGFNYIVKETVAPVAPYSTTVIGVRA